MTNVGYRERLGENGEREIDEIEREKEFCKLD
jgi:hypothetical protein